jgi:hypothetical protein
MEPSIEPLIGIEVNCTIFQKYDFPLRVVRLEEFAGMIGCGETDAG